MTSDSNKLRGREISTPINTVYQLSIARSLVVIVAGFVIDFVYVGEGDQFIGAVITVIVAFVIHLFWQKILGVKKKPQKAVAGDEKAAPEEPVSATAATPPSISDTGVFKLGEKDTNKEEVNVFLFYLQALHEEEFSDDADGRFACACHHVEEFVQAIETRAVEGSHFVIVSTETPQAIIPVSKIEQLREYTDREKDSDDIKFNFDNERGFHELADLAISSYVTVTSPSGCCNRKRFSEGSTGRSCCPLRRLFFKEAETRTRVLSVSQVSAQRWCVSVKIPALESSTRACSSQSQVPCHYTFYTNLLY